MKGDQAMGANGDLQDSKSTFNRMEIMNLLGMDQGRPIEESLDKTGGMQDVGDLP